MKAWLDDHRSNVNAKPLYLAYFGAADPKAYGLDAERLPQNHSTGDQTFSQFRGGIYCVSATTLQSVYAREIGPWSRAYEQQYQGALAQMKCYRATASDPSVRVALVANDGPVSWLKRIRIFERLRFERLCAHLRHRTADAQVGYSIFVFNLSDAEVQCALYGEPAELTPKASVAGY